MVTHGNRPEVTCPGTGSDVIRHVQEVRSAHASPGSRLGRPSWTIVHARPERMEAAILDGLIAHARPGRMEAAILDGLIAHARPGRMELAILDGLIAHARPPEEWRRLSWMV